MTGHRDRPDVAQRRRISRLRADLGLSFMPPHIGSELRTVTPQVVERVEARLLGQPPGDPALSPGGQRQLLVAIARAVDEFAHIVEDRPPRPPAVESMVAELIRIEGQVEPCVAALRTAFRVIREVMGGLWPQLPHASSHVAKLDVALVRYAERLCTRTMKAPRRPMAPPPPHPAAEDAPVAGLLALIANRWGTRPVQLYLSVSTLGATDLVLPAPGRPHAAGPVQHGAERPLRVVTTDHVVMVTRHPVPPPRSSRTTRHPVVVCAGPMPVAGIAVAYDTALLLLRLISAGVASPPSPVQIPMPNLGFLHPYPGESSVRKIGELLRPLTKQAVHRRIALARTMQLRLRTAGTAQGLAKQLAVHPQTIHNHLVTLRELYNQDLDFHDETLAIQAALDLVLPLWELEQQDPRSGHRSTGGCRRTGGYEAGYGDEDEACQECPAKPEDLP